MVLISATRLRVRSLFYLPQFSWATLLSARQLTHAAGFLGGRLLIDRYRNFWTLTAWEDETAMRRFRNDGVHRKVMPKLLQWCDEATLVHWHQETPTLPDWQEAHQRMISEGKLSKVNHPSPNHATKDFPEPRVGLLSRDLQPASRRASKAVQSAQRRAG
jgi:Domain of unknown function (DUF3291)